MLAVEVGLTFGDAPWIATATNFATIDLDHRIGADNCEWHTAAQLAQHLGLFFVFERLGEVVDFNFVLSNFVEDLGK